VTAKLLISQTKMLLDKNMIEKGLFTPSFEELPLNRIVSDTVKIMQQQASLRKIQISYEALKKEQVIMMD
jgi:hypothetical protein